MNVPDCNNDRISNKGELEPLAPVENPAVENSYLDNIEINPTKRR